MLHSFEQNLMIHFLKKNHNSINACLFVISIYFFEIFQLGLNFNLHIGFFGFFIIFLNTIFFGKIFKETKIFSSIIALLLIINVSIGHLMPCESLHMKMILSSFAFFIVFVISFNLGLNIHRHIFDRYVVNTSIVLLLISVTYLLIQFYLSDHQFKDFHGDYLVWSFAHQSYDGFNPRLSSFFGEPSYLAIKTIILYCLIITKRDIKNYSIIILSASIYFWFAFSAVFLILFILIFFLLIAKYLFFLEKKIALIFLIAFNFVLIELYYNDFNFIAANYPYLYTRLSFLVDSSFSSLSFSGLVYLQSWLDAYGSFINTGGLGSGFNQENCFPRFPGIILELASTYPNPIHHMTGGTVFFAKFLNEWGIIGISIFVLIISFFIYYFPKITSNKYLLRLLIGILIIFSISLIRSNTYFQFVILPFLFAFFIKQTKEISSDNS